MDHTKVRQLSGPGIKGLEHCPPAYHFDFSHEEFQTFIADPAETMKQLGLKLTVATVTLSRWSESYSEKAGWSARAPSARAKGVCCYSSGDGGVTCHMHG